MLADSDALVEALCEADVFADSLALVDALSEAEVLADSLALVEADWLAEFDLISLFLSSISKPARGDSS